VGWKRYKEESGKIYGFVEREPMWDGNKRRLTKPVLWDMLSENQCGMETLRENFPKIKSLVEREPMWDGNYKGYSLLMISWYVEREPMWDGNGNALWSSCSSKSS